MELKYVLESSQYEEHAGPNVFPIFYIFCLLHGCNTECSTIQTKYSYYVLPSISAVASLNLFAKRQRQGLSIKTQEVLETILSEILLAKLCWKLKQP